MAGNDRMCEENSGEGAIRQERIRIAEELDIPLQTASSALMRLGVKADSLPSDSAVKIPVGSNS